VTQNGGRGTGESVPPFETRGMAAAREDKSKEVAMYNRDILAGKEAAQAPDLPFTDAAVLERHSIEGDGPYSAVVEDLGFMWRWSLFRGHEMCQHGCSLTERASREAVGHVLAFYGIRDGGKAAQ
jgi:soluble methane monooxygenase-binding protein MmoD